jgi:hypothetical protein
LVPEVGLNLYRKLKRAAEHRRNTERTTEQVFTEIYAKNSWGGDKGEFFSGGGTADESISGAYVDCLKELGKRLELGELHAVDLGCGDMKIGTRISEMFSSYTGVDIVEELVKRHNQSLGTETRRFLHLDIIEDDLPDGDLCMIRQVLQHLSNAQIVKILQKVKKYKYVLITEHNPSPNPGLRKNLDKPHGGDIRIYDNSGIYLEDPPFGIPREQLEVVLEVAGHGYENFSEPWMKGVIQTVMYRPGEPGTATGEPGTAKLDSEK